MDFSNGNLAKDEFPIRFYEELLGYVRNQYAGLYWQALPHEVAEHVYQHRRNCLNPNLETAGQRLFRGGTAALGPPGGSFFPRHAARGGDAPGEGIALAAPAGRGSSSDAPPTRRPGARVAGRPPARSGATAPRFQGQRAAVLLFSYYPADPRPRRAAEALAREGMGVDLICLRSSPEEPTRESYNGVSILRVPLKRRRGGKPAYIFQYSAFIFSSFVLLGVRSLRRRYDLVHVHNMPDVLVFSALIPKARGAKVILDLHDPMPELMMTIFNLRQESLSVRLLKRLEKGSIGFSDLTLTVNLACKKLFAARSCPAEKIRVVMNSPDETIFGFHPLTASAATAANRRDPAKPFAIMYHGSLVERNGLDLAVEALERIRTAIPTAELRIYGSPTPFMERVMDSVHRRGLQSVVRYLGAKRLEQIVEAIEQCDLGLIPNRRSIFTEMNTPTRIFEYLARGKPVIAPRTGGIEDYFTPQDIVFFELGNAEDLARQIEYVFHHPGAVAEAVRRGQQVYLAHRWSEERLGLVGHVAELLPARE